MQKLSMPRIGTDRASTSLTVTPPRAELEGQRTQIQSLPGWAASRIGWLGTVQIDGETKFYLTSGLPKLTDQERQQIENQLAALDALVKPGAGDDRSVLALVTTMLLALASANTSEAGAQARGEAYMFALGDMPAWAVDEAIKNWYTGKVRGVEESDFKWSPSPAVLLRATRDVLAPYEDTAGKLRRLIEAKPLDEILQ